MNSYTIVHVTIHVELIWYDVIVVDGVNSTMSIECSPHVGICHVVNGRWIFQSGDRSVVAVAAAPYWTPWLYYLLVVA